MFEQQHQERVVVDHFRAVSAAWGPRYERRPRRMSDLDLQLRRENIQRLLQSVAERKSRLPMQVLDLGCGAGNVLDHVPRELVDVIGVDVVPEMVKQAAITHPSDAFVVADASRLPIRPESLDAITCAGVLEYLTDPRRTLEAAWTGLRPGGVLIVSFPNRTSWFRTLSRWEAAVERGLVRIRDRILARPRESDGRPAYAHTQWTLATARELLKAAGFSVETVRLQTFGLWGRIGRTRPALWVSRWLSTVLARDSAVSRKLACTVVVLARKPGPRNA